MSAGAQNGRRPPLFSNGLVVLTESLDADPADAAPGEALLSDAAALNGSVEPGSKDKKEEEEEEGGGETEPLPLSMLQLFKLAAVYQPAWRLHEKLEAAHPPQKRKGGPRRKCLFIEVIMVLIASWLLPVHSKRLLLRQLNDPENWALIVAAVEAAYPDDKTRRLRPKPLTRRQFQWWRDFVAVQSGFKDLLDGLDETAADVALDVGLFAPNAPVTHPRTENTITGDGKEAGALIKARIDQAVDPDTGEKLRSYDPDARQFTASYENRMGGDPDDLDDERRPRWRRQAGYHMVHISARGPDSGIRVPLSMRLLEQPDPDDPKGECSVAVDMALRMNNYITSEGGEVSAFTYDGGMYSEHRSKLLDAGIIPVGRLQRGPNDSYAERKLGMLKFKLRDGTERRIKSTATDATPNFQSRLVDGREITIGLEQKKLQWNPQAERLVLWGHWEVPDLPGVPKALRKARALIQHNNTDTEIKNKNLRTRALVPITENNPDFEPMFGHRQDSESLNSDLERRLINGRVGAITRNRNLIDLSGYQHSCCIRALASHMIHNKLKKLPQWFGEHELPDYIVKSELTDEP